MKLSPVVYALCGAGVTLMMYPLVLPRADIASLSSGTMAYKILVLAGILVITVGSFLIADREPTIPEHMHITMRVFWLSNIAAVFVTIGYSVFVIVGLRWSYGIWPDLMRMPAPLLLMLLTHFVACAPGALLYCILNKN